ncbi:unnamed protein product [Schistosoma margrebowiei]|uniref:Uncharacterized protein n=1 Tax=Schistosoma margrebowiei TaxID=48269 RepID=A0A3P8E563_9TREM|nr:unnamed protein product [Schistosoma margrebowiei]
MCIVPDDLVLPKEQLWLEYYQIQVPSTLKYYQKVTKKNREYCPQFSFYPKV